MNYGRTILNRPCIERDYFLNYKTHRERLQKIRSVSTIRNSPRADKGENPILKMNNKHLQGLKAQYN
jgi:hypothetical protein